MMEKKEIIDALVDELNEHNYKYYVLCEPVISDYDFDMKLKELESLEAETGYVREDSPTQRVGSDVQESFGEIERTKIMGSIANCYDRNELKNWLNSFPESTKFLMEPKYDGSSCSLVYVNGVLMSASTRGTGYKGADITKNVKTIKSIPLKLYPHKNCVIYGDYHYKDIYVPDIIEIRGEILMPKSVLKEINKERLALGEDPLSNERNGAAGSLKQLDTKVTASRGLIFKPYSVICDDDEFCNKYLKEQYMALDVTEIFGFSHSNYWRLSDAATVMEFVDDFEKRFLKKQDYCMDGCVIKVQSLNQQRELGYTQKVPKWAKAFKFKQEPVSTILEYVEWRVGRTGQLNPVGILEPCTVDNVTVSNVTLNNMEFIKDNCIQLNSYVFIERGGCVIPKVTGVDEERNLREGRKPFDIECPTVCPFCGTELVKAKEDGAHIFCPNTECTERNLAKLTYFVSKECMDIEGLSEKGITRLYMNLGVRKWSDLYKLEYSDLVNAGFGDKNSLKLYDSIKKSRTESKAENVLMSLGIPMIGKVTAKKLMETFGSIKTLQSVINNDLPAIMEIAEIEGVGEVASGKLCEYIRNNPDELEKVYENLRYEYVDENVKDSDKLSGMTILATGTLDNFSRDEIKESVVKNGGKYASGVSSKLTFMIVGSDPGASKLTKAEALGIKIISENEYLNLIK